MERFKVVLRGYDEFAVYGETEGEECFRMYGQRFFLHRYMSKEKREWRVSCALSGGAVGWGVFPEDAIKMARKKLFNNHSAYLTKLRTRARAKWKLNGRRPSIRTNSLATAAAVEG